MDHGFHGDVFGKSHDLNQVGVLFAEYVSQIKVGQALKDHTEICKALDFLWNYISTEKRGVRLRVLYADCDPIWFSTNELKMFLRMECECAKDFVLVEERRFKGTQMCQQEELQERMVERFP